MNGLLTALCSFTGWAQSDSLRQRLAHAAPGAAATLGLGEHAAHWLGDRRFLPLLAERCAVPETYFFRHQQQLEANAAAAARSFPEGPLRVWVAGCSTGEELYSLTIELVLAGAAASRLELLGTDLAEGFLAQARAARYGPWSFRGVSPEVRARFFTSDGAQLTVAQRYRQPARFERHNLAEQAAPLAQAQLISCRNVLIYFRPEAALATLGRLVAALAPGGLLILGTAEQHLGLKVGLEALPQGSQVLLRKPGPGPLAAPPAALPQVSLPARVRPTPPRAGFADAWQALQEGDLAAARALAEPVAGKDPEAQLVLASLAEHEGDLCRAEDHLRRALYLDPQRIVAHAAQARLYARLGREKDAARARTNALRHLKEVTPETVLRAAVPVTAAELRASLEVE